MPLKTCNIEIFPGAVYQFEYTNHRDETELRTATFKHFQIIGEGHERYYPAGTHCFYMIAHDRNDHARSFAISNIDFSTWKKI